MSIGIVLLAMVAAFLALRLYSVLGKRTGHEQTFVTPVDAPTIAPAAPTDDPRPLVGAQPEMVFASDAAAGVRAIVAADSSFDVARFLEGAKSAYRMIMEAYWRGDEAAYAPYVGEEVRAAFAESIAERTSAGHVLDNRLVVIENALITEASLVGKQATITVRFDADVAAVTRDADGTVIAGSMSDAVETHDDWTFTRTLRSDDPNWILVETDQTA